MLNNVAIDMLKLIQHRGIQNVSLQYENRRKEEKIIFQKDNKLPIFIFEGDNEKDRTKKIMLIFAILKGSITYAEALEELRTDTNISMMNTLNTIKKLKKETV